MEGRQLTEKQQTPRLYDARFEHDNCGIGAVVNIGGMKTHKTVEDAIKIVEIYGNTRGRKKDAEGKTATRGILLADFPQIFSKARAKAAVSGLRRERSTPWSNVLLSPRMSWSRN